MGNYIITLTLQWGDILDPTNPDKTSVLGWGIEINGLRPDHCKIFRGDMKGHPMVETIRGPIIDLLISPRQAPELGRDNGADPTQPPVNYITDLLDSLGAAGYELASNNTIHSSGDEPLTVWTLQKNRQ